MLGRVYILTVLSLVYPRIGIAFFRAFKMLSGEVLEFLALEFFSIHTVCYNCD
jgi:hypothetical protein